jgi:addiction module HigA family antidote
MTTRIYTAKRNPNRCPSHPGAVLDDILQSLSYSKAEIARMSGISRQQLYDILGEKKPVSATVAAKLGKLLGNGPGIWLRMQASYDAWHAEREVDVSGIRTLEPA